MTSRGTIRTFRSLVDITVGSELGQALLSKNYGGMSTSGRAGYLS